MAISRMVAACPGSAAIAALVLVAVGLTACTSVTKGNGAGSSAPRSPANTGAAASGSSAPPTPPALPNAGTVYVTNLGKDGTGNTLSVIAPNATTATSITIGSGPNDVEIAPAGTPNASTLYVTHFLTTTSAANTLSVIAPGATTASRVARTAEPNAVQQSGGLYVTAAELAVAPAGTPNAGTVYVTDNDGGNGTTVSVIASNATASTTIAVGVGPDDVAVAPAGTPAAGTVYVTNGTSGTLSVIAPDATTSTVRVGTQPEELAIAP